MNILVLERIGASKRQLPRTAALFVGMVLLVILAATGSLERAAIAQTVVEFVVLDTVKIDKGEVLVVTSGAMNKKELGNCKSGSFPVQNAVVMTPDSSGTPKRLVAGFMPLGDARRAGTRIVAITAGDVCGPGYRKFSGTVK